MLLSGLAALSSLGYGLMVAYRETELEHAQRKDGVL